MKDFRRNIWSVLIKALLLRCTIKVVHYNRSKVRVKKYLNNNLIYNDYD